MFAQEVNDWLNQGLGIICGLQVSFSVFNPNSYGSPWVAGSFLLALRPRGSNLTSLNLCVFICKMETTAALTPRVISNMNRDGEMGERGKVYN